VAVARFGCSAAIPCSGELALLDPAPPWWRWVAAATACPPPPGVQGVGEAGSLRSSSGFTEGSSPRARLARRLSVPRLFGSNGRRLGWPSLRQRSNAALAAAKPPVACAFRRHPLADAAGFIGSSVVNLSRARHTGSLRGWDWAIAYWIGVITHSSHHRLREVNPLTAAARPGPCSRIAAGSWWSLSAFHPRALCGHGAGVTSAACAQNRFPPLLPNDGKKPCDLCGYGRIGP